MKNYIPPIIEIYSFETNHIMTAVSGNVKGNISDMGWGNNGGNTGGSISDMGWGASARRDGWNEYENK